MTNTLCRFTSLKKTWAGKDGPMKLCYDNEPAISNSASS